MALKAGFPCGTSDALMKTKLSQLPLRSGGARAKNRYDSRCHFCGEVVLAWAGCVEKDERSGGWAIFC